MPLTTPITSGVVALCAIAQHFGRPGTPIDQAWIKSFNGHLKGEYPDIERIDNRAVLGEVVSGDAGWLSGVHGGRDP